MIFVRGPPFRLIPDEQLGGSVKQRSNLNAVNKFVTSGVVSETAPDRMAQGCFEFSSQGVQRENSRQAQILNEVLD